MKKLFRLLIASPLFFSGCLAITPPTAKVTVKVLDEEGRPVAGAKTGIGIGAVTSVGVDGSTGSDGIFTGEVAGWGKLGYGAEKTGYYNFLRGIPVRDVQRGLAYRWEPWNPTVVATLRPILNPVPMYARGGIWTLPQLETACGFDLIAGDWLTPYGQGKVAHVYFTGTRDYIDRDNFRSSLKVTMSGKTSGFILHEEDLDGGGSYYKLPRFAPETGYMSTLSLARNSGPSPFNRKTSYLFRTMTVENAGGDTISALYGKFYGPIRCDLRETSTLTILFTYYLNPDGTRNLEFDPKRNLFQGKIPDAELVGRP